ncbi:hypothetical protein BV25DRAFT_1916991 [Artomyces pyxidatus]|uniref:Uncharacterized protein n=1 Tax=Artomyces pyxidatus TaxID=48021 RepID=A0ACB8SY44_9AGAM|nr:hypothetical protein BV25DRAFT_1916991 [Artomyces pyxidatus]
MQFTQSVFDRSDDSPVWKRIKGMLEEAVTNGRAERLEEQRAHTRRSRHIAALGEYSKFRQLILPAQWAYLPNAPQAAVALACFQEVINKEEDVTTADWASAVQKLPQCLSEWMENKKAQYLAMLPVSNVVFPAMEVTQLDSPSVGVVRREGMESYANVLELVLSVFTTDGQCALFGRDTCRTWELEPHDVTFSLRGAQAALALAQTLEVDPKLTKATALDKLNRRFVCMTCVQKDGNSIDHMSAYSWRGCVEHYMKTEKSDHPAPQWRVLDAQRTANIILREIALPANAQRDSARAWFCNHCSLYRVDDRMGPMMYAMHSSLQTRAIVTDHLRSVHNIAAPVDGVDLLYHVHPGERRPIPQPVLVNPRQTVTQPPQNATQFRCAHCQPSSGMHPGPVAKRLFKLDGLKSHAMAKHDINRVLEPGIDYY